VLISNNQIREGGQRPPRIGCNQFFNCNEKIDFWISYVLLLGFNLLRAYSSSWVSYFIRVLSFPWIRCPFCDFCCSCFHRRLHFFCLVLCVRPVRSVRKRRFSLCSSNRGMVQFLYDELSFSSHARTAPCFMVPRSSVVSRCSPAEHSSIPIVHGFNSRLIFNS
jgi:hypothetical protein